MFHARRIPPSPDIAYASRRLFIQGVGAAVAALLSACLGNPSTTVSTPSEASGLPDEGYIGKRENYSETIISYGLRPREFDYSVTGDERVEAAISYLYRLGQVLKDNPSINPPLALYRITGDEAMFPIALPSEGKLSDMFDIYFGDGDKTSTYYDKKHESRAYAGTRTNSFVFQDGRWQRQDTIIRFTKVILGDLNFKERDGEYRQMTDLDLALILIYEYSHALREDAILTLLQAEGALPPEPKTEEENRGSIELVREALVAKDAELIHNQGTNYRRPDRFANAAQGNALSCMALYALEQLNFKNGDSGLYMPGSRLLNPLPNFIPPENNLYWNFHKYLKKPNGAPLLDVSAWVDVAGLSP